MEQVMRSRRDEDIPAPPLGCAGPPPAAAGLVTVASGIYRETVAAGLPVSELRRRCATSLDLEPGSRAVVHGDEVGDDYVPAAAETVVFTKRAGEKG